MHELLAKLVKDVVSVLKDLDEPARITALNQIRLALHLAGPFQNEPVDLVLWVAEEDVSANNYNPNQCAPPEMRLLEHSVREDGFTQPIVTWRQGNSYEVVDGFHRKRVGEEIPDIKARLKSYLPVTIINESREGRSDRIAATIRHNRARGKHRIDGMSDIVQELARRNWTDKRIGRELGMEPDEVLRLKQITGLAELFSDHEFSTAWEPELEGDKL